MASADKQLPPTERVSTRYEQLDGWPAAEAVSALVDGHWASVAAVSAASAALAEAVEQATARLDSDDKSRLVYVGAGSSARIAVADLAELHPTFGWPDSRGLCMMAGGASTAQSESGKAEDKLDAAEDDLRAAQLTANDVVIGLAASGNTPYTRAVLRGARAAGAYTVAISNNPAGKMLADAEHAVVLNSGPEVLAGSTRLAAGTAQKIALNSFSTALMARLGGIYRGYMVDMVPSNDKLLQRAIAMVSAITPCEPSAAEAALISQGWHIKRAVAQLWCDNSQDLEAQLAACGHNLRRLRATLDA